MKNFEKRIQKAEQKSNPEPMPEFEIQLCDNRDHIDHPENYSWNDVPQMSRDGVTVKRPTKK